MANCLPKTEKEDHGEVIDARVLMRIRMREIDELIFFVAFNSPMVLRMNVKAEVRLTVPQLLSRLNYQVIQDLC